MMSTVYIAGDASGHAQILEHWIRSIGGDPDRGWLPPGVVFIHTGDLVHKGPESDRCVSIADRLINRWPDRFISIWGNHDAAYVDGAPSVQGRRLVKPVKAATAATLRSWWECGRLPMAVAVDTPREQWLITHAGLTTGYWRQLGEPDHRTCARILNNMVGTRAHRAFRPGVLIHGRVSSDAGPCWAETGRELLQPWFEHADSAGRVPFSQIHGHSSVVQDYDDMQPWPHIADWVIKRVYVDRVNRRYTAQIDDQQFIGVDWLMFDHPPARLPPLLEIPDARVRL